MCIRDRFSITGVGVSLTIGIIRGLIIIILVIWVVVIVPTIIWIIVKVIPIIVRQVIIDVVIILMLTIPLVVVPALVVTVTGVLVTSHLWSIVPPSTLTIVFFVFIAFQYLGHGLHCFNLATSPSSDNIFIVVI